VELSVVLPTYNERDNILPLIERLDAALASVGHEILVVDDDSPDGTAARVETYAAGHPTVRVIRRVGVRGLVTAIQEGIAQSRGDAVAWMDADLSMPPELVAALYAALPRADVALGSRYVAGGSDGRDNVPVHRLFSGMLNAALRLLLGTGVTDYTSGFLCVKRSVLREIPLTGDYGEYCIEFLHRARRRGFRIVELPYRNAPRVHGESKTAAGVGGLLRRGWRYVWLALRMRAVVGR
jgi:dolichol-phosphate mannosyltransferase